MGIKTIKSRKNDVKRPESAQNQRKNPPNRQRHFLGCRRY